MEKQSLQSIYQYTVRKKCPHSELFWSAFSRIRPKNGKILCISPYSVRIWENADQNNSEYERVLRSYNCLFFQNLGEKNA